MYGMNKVYLVGFLGSNPQATTSKNGKNYTKLNLATHRSIKDAEGEWNSLTDWHNINVWGKRGETCQKYLKKGSKVMVEGYLNHYEFTDDNGSNHKQTAITAQNIEFFNAPQTLQ